METDLALLFALFWRIQECLEIKVSATKKQREIVRKGLLRLFKNFDEIYIYVEPQLQLESFFNGFCSELWDHVVNIIPDSRRTPNFHKRVELGRAMEYYIWSVTEKPCCEKSRKCSIDKINRSEFENCSFEKLNECFESWIKRWKY